MISANPLKCSGVFTITVYANIKSIGKRKPVFERIPYKLPDDIKTLRSLIETIVRLEVAEYNKKPTGVKLLPFLTDEEIEDAKTVGKISFGTIYNSKKANPEKAIETALAGFSDGLFKVLINDCEVDDIDSEIALADGDILTFIKLTFLAGRRF
jgi:hypothetical protein